MYGTVAFVRVKPGMEAQLLEFDRMEQAITIPGHVGGYVYRLDSVPNGYVLAIVFESKAAYQANAQSPEQDARYRDMLTFLDGEPDWHDGEIIAAFHRP